MSRTENAYLTVGKVVSTHGLKGEVKVYPLTDDARRLEDLEKVVLLSGRERLELTVSQVRYFKKLVILKFKEFTRIEDVEKYRGARLLVPREDAVKLEENEYFDCDLIGMEVMRDDGRRLGALTDVLHTGANDVYEVETEEDGMVLLPAIRECILKVDAGRGIMEVHVMDGLIPAGKKGGGGEV